MKTYYCNSRFLVRLGLGLIVVLAWNSSALFATPSISVNSVKAGKGSSVDIPVTFTADKPGVSSLQFDVVLPNGVSNPTVTAGAAAKAAEKSVQSSPVAGGLRVLVFGVNQKTIASGAVATIHLATSKSASGAQPIQLQGVIASAPDATKVNLKSQNGALNIE